MDSFITREAVGIFPGKFMKSYRYWYNYLSICSTKLRLNVTARFLVKFGKCDIFMIFWKFHFLMRKSSGDIPMLLAWLVSSTSPSGGNLVDGLPPASSNTGAAPASWKPQKCWTIDNFWCFFFEVMHSFITRRAGSIFRSKFIENIAWKCNHLSICSIKVKLNVTGSFR